MNESSPLSNVSSDSEREIQEERQYSGILTALCFMVCLCGFGLFLWNMTFSDVFRESATVNRDLERLASRILGFESRLFDLSSFEQAMFHLWGEDGDTQEQVRQWYAELPRERRSPLDELYAGILDGEEELRTTLRESMNVWNSGMPPTSEFRRILGVVYLDENNVHGDYDMLQARLAEEVPGNWFYFQLAGRLASQSGDHALREHLHHQFQQLTDSELWKWRTLVIVECTVGGIGFLYLVYMFMMWFKRRAVQSVDMFNQRISPWTFQEGIAVLVRGGALSIVFIVLVAVVPLGVNILEDYGSLLLYLPTVGLALVLLRRSTHQSFLEVLGCHDVSQRLISFFPIIMSVIALGIMGDWLIMLGGDTLAISTHWTEWFLPQLVWGSQVELLKTTIEVVVLAPIFEEIIFRGIVYSTLRTKFGFPVSMIVSAGIFAVAHGYGVVAFLSVFWSGMLWAWMYERTGSVVPGICVHAVNNALVVSFLVALFR